MKTVSPRRSVPMREYAQLPEENGVGFRQLKKAINDADGLPYGVSGVDEMTLRDDVLDMRDLHAAKRIHRNIVPKAIEVWHRDRNDLSRTPAAALQRISKATMLVRQVEAGLERCGIDTTMTRTDMVLDTIRVSLKTLGHVLILPFWEPDCIYTKGKGGPLDDSETD